MSHLRKALRFAIVGGALAIAPGPVLAQSKPSTNSREASVAPTEAALAVGALQIGSVANLEVAGFDIAVTAGSIVYSYYFTNKGNADLAVAASASLPELHASADRSETWTLARNDPENFVDLTITAGGGPVDRPSPPTRSASIASPRSKPSICRCCRLAPGPTRRCPLSPATADQLAALGIPRSDAAEGAAHGRLVARSGPHLAHGDCGRCLISRRGAQWVSGSREPADVTGPLSFSIELARK